MKRMRLAMWILMCFLLALTIFYPTGVIYTAIAGYTFELVSVPVFAVALAVLSVCTVLLDLIRKDALEDIGLLILLAVVTPFSFINALFYISKYPHIEVIVGVLLSAACCSFLACRHVKSDSLKTVVLVLAIYLIAALGYSGFFSMMVGDFAENTVVKTAESPNGERYAQVIDNDQGALGGATIVKVYENFEINALLFKIEKKPQRVYLGDWGEFMYLEVYWKDDNCLVIDSAEYEIS